MTANVDQSGSLANGSAGDWTVTVELSDVNGRAGRPRPGEGADVDDDDEES